MIDSSPCERERGLGFRVAGNFLHDSVVLRTMFRVVWVYGINPWGRGSGVRAWQSGLSHGFMGFSARYRFSPPKVLELTCCLRLQALKPLLKSLRSATAHGHDPALCILRSVSEVL